ncbi:MAG: hypothetical protein WCC65_04645, partial [Pseudonocardiaceae bacterium]
MATSSSQWRAALATGLVTLTVGCGPMALPSTPPQDIFDTTAPSPSSSANPMEATDSPTPSPLAVTAPPGGTDINLPGSTPTNSPTMPQPGAPGA